MSEHRVEDPVQHSRVARNIRRFAVPIAILWVAVAALTNVLVPTLEVVGARHTVAQSSSDSPSLKAMKHIGKVFGEFDSDSNAMIVLEGDQPLGADAHQFYATLVKKLSADTTHVEHVQDFWGDPLTAAGSQSKDGKAALVQLYLRGNQGESTSNESVDAIRTIVADTPPPPGVKAYVTGAAPLTTDQFEVGSSENVKITAVTFGVIAVMLLVVYRSIITMILMLMTVMVELSAARGVVATLANSGIISLSTYTTNLLTLLAIAAGADYVIFVVGRYQEARSAGEEREAAYYTMFRGIIHVIIGSGLTIAGAVACLSFTRLPYFQSLGLPAALGVLVALAAALTLGPAMLVMASHFGLLEPKHATRTRGWRRIGTVIVRWPGPVLVASIALALIGLLALPGYKTRFRCPPVSARHGACGRRVRGCRTPLLPGPAQSRAADDRIRSRHAKPRGHDPARAGGQGGTAYPWHRLGAVDHPAPGHANQPQLHPVSDQRVQRQHDHEPQLPAGQGPGHSEAG